jgi:membrane protease YdiL (CAAX protease family)
VNFDKTLGAVGLLALSGWTPMRLRQDWTAAIRRAAPLTVMTVIVVMAASLAVRFVRFEPGWSPLFGVWAVVNLLTTCVSEEAFFRGFIQQEIGGRIGLVGSALLFGLAHVAGGWTYVGLATLAGAGCAAVFWRTASLEMCILTHFVVNAVHFLCFTYPSLTQGDSLMFMFVSMFLLLLTFAR